MSVLSKIKDWLTSDSNSANRISYYGGGTSTKRAKDVANASAKKAKKKKKKEEQEQASSTAVKATPPSVKKAEAKDKQTAEKPSYSSAFSAKRSLPKTNSEKLQEQMDANIKARLNAPQSASTVKKTPPTIRHHSTALGTLSESDTKSRLAKMNVEKLQQKERSRAADMMKPAIDEKYSERNAGAPAYAKQGNYAADPDVAKYNVLKHPYATSATRGAVSGTTFGLSELAISKLSKGEAKEAEKFYQANKSKGAETVGELAGSAVSFGGTGAITDKLGGKLVSKVAPNAATKLAEKQFIKNAAESLVKRGVETNVVGGATEELVKQVGKDKATKIVRALGNDIVQNLTTGAIYDVNKASAKYKVGSKEWWKELGSSALFNSVVTTGIAGGTMVTGGRQLVENAADTVAKRLDFRSNFRPAGNVEPRRQLPRIGESIEDRIARVNTDRAVKRYPDIEDQYLDYDGTIAAVNRYYDPDATAEAAVDRYHDLDIQRAKPKAEPMAEVPKIRTLKDRIADADDFDEFVKANTKDAEAKEYVKANKMSGLKGLWHEQRIAKHKKGIHKISIEEANEATRKAIPENVLDGWFRSANSGYKPRLVDAIAKDPDAINAGMNVAYHNYVNANPESPLPFDEWLNTPQKMYRGTHGQDAVDEDIFSAFTPDRNVAEKHAGKSGNARIEEIEVKPIDTLGSYQTTVEQEYLVPKSVVEANAPKAEVPTAEVAAEPPKVETRQERMLSRADEKADAIRAELGVDYTEPAKGTKPAAETLAPKDVKREYTVQLKRENGKNQKVKVEATSEKEALDKAIGRKKGVKNASIVGSAEAQPKAELPNAQAAKQETKNINLDDSVGKERTKKTFREQFHELASSAKTKISDSLNAFEEANKQYIKTDYQKWLENVGAIDKTRRYNAIAARSIDDAQVKWNGDVFEGGKSLKSIYDGMDKATEKDFDKYLLMRHAPDRIREGKPIFAGTQYDSVEACEREARALLEKHPEFAERADELYQYTRNELQNRVDAGLLKQEVADEWSKKYPNYVPTGRDGDFGGEYDIWDIRGQLNGNTIGAGEIQKAKGGDQPIRSIKEQLADATSRNWRDMSMNNLFRKMFGDKVGDELATYADGGLEKVLDNTVNLSKAKDGGKYFAEVFENGEMKRVEIEKSFYDAIEDLYKNGRFGNGIDVMTDAVSKVAYPFKQLVTSWNPIFMVKNGLRDFPEAIINSRQTKEFLECMPAAIKELQSGGEFYEAFRNSGVSQANFVNLEEALTKGDNWLKKRVNKFATAQEMVETYPRLIEYMATIKKAGYDLKNGIKDVPMEIRDIAAANAADVTVNFGRSGSVGKMLNRGLVPFFNPSVQGWSKFLRNFSEQGSAKAFIGFSVKALALGAGVQAVNNFMLEDNKNYQQISARDKATNIIIPITWGKDVTADNTNLFVKIPKSRFAATLSLPMVNASNDNKMGWAEMIRVAKDQVFVVDPSESNILSPLLLAKQNKTWYGSPIVPKALEDLPKSEQYDANTSKIGKALGKATANLPEELQISPKKADYIIDAETGVIGDFFLPAFTPSRQGGGNALQKVGHSTGNALKRAWTIDSVTQNDLSTRFYDKMQKANTASQSAKGTQADKDEYKRLTGYSKEVGKINTAIRTLQNGNRKTKQEDIYGLQKVRNQMMQDALDGKGTPSEYKTMDAIQKYVGTTYAINNFGTAADKEAMRLYGMAEYGDISKSEMRKAINDDKGFFKGVKSIGNLKDKIVKAGTTSDTTLTKAVALASSDSNDNLFGAYGATYKSRTESDNKMNRARTYFKDGGSEDEYVKLEMARKTMGKLPEDDEAKELDKLDDQVAKGEISLAERKAKADSIEYNANLSYLGLATSFAQANAPERAYRLYDIKDKNIQKGINLAAMGFTARDYKEMSKALDTNGNGYPSKQEIIDYVSSSGVKDKATLFDALYYYQGKSNPFGSPTNYTREQAAAMGAKNGIKSIVGDSKSDNKEFDLNPESTSSSRGYGYRRYGYRRWHNWGSSSKKSDVPMPKLKQSAFNAKSAKSRGSIKTGIDIPSTVGRSSGVNAKIDVTPLNIKTVKPSSSKSSKANFAAALEDIKATEKKVAPPKARRSK